MLIIYLLAYPGFDFYPICGFVERMGTSFYRYMSAIELYIIVNDIPI